MREGRGSGERSPRSTPPSTSDRKTTRSTRPARGIASDSGKGRATRPARGEQGPQYLAGWLDASLKVTVGKSGRVTLPASIRNELELDEGSELNVQVEAGEVVLTPVVTVPRHYEWAYAREHLDHLESALADADEGRIRPLEEDELTQLFKS